ncbi:MAG: hypothetical protein HY909_17100 [Deltaproteobacteria bacterium]|nr:hypothetical protein [Deltaproteobacteria bacterium]
MLTRVKLFGVVALALWASSAGAIPLLNGLGGPSGYGIDRLPNNDDGFSGAIDVSRSFGGGTGLNFFGTRATSLFVNNNGNVSFTAGLSDFTPLRFPLMRSPANPIIAPWWADVDTRPGSPTPPSDYGVYWSVRPGQFVATWHFVGYYGSGGGHYDLLNDFQVILRDRSDVVAGDFDVEFRYNRCQWTTGDASRGSGGLGGTPAQAGFDAGNGRDFQVLPGSFSMAVLRLCDDSNQSPPTPGLWRFQIRSGNIATCGNSVRETGEECDDGNTRGGDGCSSSCFMERDNGGGCTGPERCRSGFCADGVCCTARCDGRCEACDVPGAVGLCSAVTGAPRGMRAVCGGEGECAGTCDGTVRDACTFPGASTTCAPATCSTGRETAASVCNGMGACGAAMTRECAPFGCGDSACRTRCARDADCAADAFCDTMTNRCERRGAPGARCSAPSQCTTGFCVDGVCCDAACDGQCEACDTSGRSGMCTSVIGPPRGSRMPCTGMAGDVCAGVCDGMNRRTCRYPPTGTSCRLPSCIDGVATLAATCDGVGNCPMASTTPCMPFTCGELECRTECRTDADCAMGNVCVMGVCMGRRPNGGMCSAASECVSGFCVDGVCCDLACGGQCEACNVAGALGACTAVMGMPRGMRAQCMGTGICGGVCDGMNRATCTYPGSATNCRPGACREGMATLPAGCDGRGGCPAEVTNRCAPFGCAMDRCRMDCTTDQDCAAGNHCAMGRCAAPEARGAGCARGSDCASGFCAQGVCCDRACDGVCEACDLAMRGTCTPRPAGSQPGVASDGGVASTDAGVGCDFCDGTGRCQRRTMDAGTGPFSGGSSGGCGCRAPRGAPLRGLGAVALALALGLRRRRRA